MEILILLAMIILGIRIQDRQEKKGKAKDA